MHSVFRTKMKMLTGLGLLGGQGELPPVPTGREDLAPIYGNFWWDGSIFSFYWFLNFHLTFWIRHPAPCQVLSAPNNIQYFWSIKHIPSRHSIKWFNYCRWGEGGDAHAQLCNCRTWREYLVRDVEIKNKSPVSWSCFPPGSQLSATCFFADPERQDYICCE